MPLVGVSYQSREIDEVYQRRFADQSETEKVIDVAFGEGIRKFAAASPKSSPLAALHLEVLKRKFDEGHDIELLTCIGIPIKYGDRMINPFRRWATYLAYEMRQHPEVRQRIIDDPILNFREDWRRRLSSSKPYRKEVFERLTLNWKQIEKDLDRFSEFPVSYMEPGSEIDFITVAERFDLIGELVDQIKEHGYRGVLLGVHHAGVTIPILDDELEGFDGYVTPLNDLGVMMFPTKASAEIAVKQTKRAIYAIKPLAGGRIKPLQAFRYVFQFEIAGCMVGASSASEVEENSGAATFVLRCKTRGLLS
jgi:hypothetical protein